MGCCCCKAREVEIRAKASSAQEETTPLLVRRILEGKSINGLNDGSFASLEVESLNSLQAEDINILWANTPETEFVFSSLGAVSIVTRYNTLLNDWKHLKELDSEFKKSMGLDPRIDIIKCLEHLPPDMRVGFGYGSEEEELYDFHLEVDPMISMSRLNISLKLHLKNSIDLFSSASNLVKSVTKEGALIQKDLAHLLDQLKDEQHPVVTIGGIKKHVHLHNIQQVEQAALVVHDVVSYAKDRSLSMMNYIMQQGDNVDIQVQNKDLNNPQVIVFSKKSGRSKRK